MKFEFLKSHPDLPGTNELKTGHQDSILSNGIYDDDISY